MEVVSAMDAERLKRAVEETEAEIPVGEYLQPVAMRKNLSGFLTAPAPVMWNIEIAKYLILWGASIG